MNNMFYKISVARMVFNPNNEKMVIVLKDLYLFLILGEKPKRQDVESFRKIH